ncbi:MAG: transcription antitermination factor NusB [Lutibacter sp.]
MINRRHIRVKVMQSIYAILQSKSDNLPSQEKYLLYSIEKLSDLYAVLLRFIVELKQKEARHLEVSKKKYFATKEELNPSTKFIDNQVFKLLEQNSILNNYLAEHHLNFWELDSEYVTAVWQDVKESELYKAYMVNEENSFRQDKNFVVSLFKEFIAPSEKLADYFEDKNMSWVDDLPYVNTWIVKSLNQLSLYEPLSIPDVFKDEDDKKFAINLFRKSVLNFDNYEQYIEDKTPNWDKDRIAQLDKILIKMAIAEFLNFPTIPTKVTINEYIELAKDYSTDKSSFFINGILDKILKEFNDQKRIEKIGRGLV